MGSSVSLTQSQATAVAAGGILGASLAMTAMMLLVMWVLAIIARWKVFTKAGEAGWKSIIPIYADYVQWRIGWKNTALFWVALALGVLGIVLMSIDGSIVTGPRGGIAFSGNAGILGFVGAVMLIAAAVLELMAAFKLFASFGHGVGWFIGYILVPFIMLLVLGFGSSQYYGPQD